jgi:hypothetical protein
VASLYPKRINGKTYWYLREMARVGGKPKTVCERYVGTAADVEALLEAREQAVLPDRTRHLAFGDVAAVWGVLDELGVAGIIDAAVGSGPSGLPLSPGGYLALAALNRLVAPRSKAGIADWWKTTAADRFTKISASALDHRRFWDAMHAVPLDELERVSQAVALRLIGVCGLDTSSVALDIVVLGTPSCWAKRAATCGNDTPRRSLTFQVEKRNVRHCLTSSGRKKVCGEQRRSSPGLGRSTGVFGCAA